MDETLFIAGVAAESGDTGLGEPAEGQAPPRANPGNLSGMLIRERDGEASQGIRIP